MKKKKKKKADVNQKKVSHVCSKFKWGQKNSYECNSKNKKSIFIKQKSLNGRTQEKRSLFKKSGFSAKNLTLKKTLLFPLLFLSSSKAVVPFLMHFFDHSSTHFTKVCLSSSFLHASGVKRLRGSRTIENCPVHSVCVPQCLSSRDKKTVRATAPVPRPRA